MKGKYVIVRGDRSGVFAGTLEEQNGREVVLSGVHHRLTGSCLPGREAFVNSHGLSLDGRTTVAEFIRLTQNAYNGSVIKNLEKAYRK